MKYILFLFFTNICFFPAQEILQKYPTGQTPYIGGYQAYYKDFHQIVQEKNLKPCSNPNEIYLLRLVVLPDSSIQFVKDLNEKYVSNNKCAYNLAREVAKYQKGWNPAKINGVNQAAVASFLIYPDDIFNGYQIGYFPTYTPPIYSSPEKNKNSFPRDFVIRFNKKRFNWYDHFLIQAEFVVTKEGKVKDIVMLKPSGVYEFDKEVENTIRILAKYWKPATMNGKAIDERYSFSIRGITDPED